MVLKTESKAKHNKLWSIEHGVFRTWHKACLPLWDLLHSVSIYLCFTDIGNWVPNTFSLPWNTLSENSQYSFVFPCLRIYLLFMVDVGGPPVSKLEDSWEVDFWFCLLMYQQVLFLLSDREECSTQNACNLWTFPGWRSSSLLWLQWCVCCLPFFRDTVKLPTDFSTFLFN